MADGILAWWRSIVTEYLPLVIGGVFVVFLLPILVMRWRLAWFFYVLTLAANGQGFSVGGAVVRPEQLGLVLLIAVAIGMRRDKSIVQRPGGVRAAFWVPLLLWLLFATIATIYQSPQPAASFYIITWMIVSLGAMLVVLQNMTDKLPLVIVGTYAIGLISSLSILGWLAAPYTAIPFNIASLDPNDGLYRITGLAFEANLMGALTCLWVAVILYWRASLPLHVHVLGYVIALAGILTQTRAVWVALVVIVFLSLLRNSRLAIRNIGVALVAALAAVSVIGANPTGWAQPLLDRASSVFDFSTGTGAFRQRSWAQAFVDIEQYRSLWTGLGVNTFEKRHADAVQAQLSDYLSNAWIVNLYDTGVFGVAALLLALIALWWGTPRRIESLGYFVALAITSSLTNSLWFAFPWVFMALLDRRPVTGRFAPRERKPAFTRVARRVALGSAVRGRANLSSSPSEQRNTVGRGTPPRRSRGGQTGRRSTGTPR